MIESSHFLKKFQKFKFWGCKDPNYETKQDKYTMDPG